MTADGTRASEKPAENAEQRFDAVAFLRVLAAVLVYFWHVEPLLSDPNVAHTRGWIGVLFTTSAWCGVWLFFFLSGYLAERGFAEGRYPLTWRGAAAFFLRRVRRVYLPTLGFLFLCCTLLFPDFLYGQPMVLLRFLTCTYNGMPGVDGVGVTWYVFSLMWLYLIAPLFALLLRRILAKPRALTGVFLALAALGIAYRLLALKLRLDWTRHVYTAPYGNLDLFLMGMTAGALSALRRGEAVPPKRLGALRALSVPALSGVILFAGYANYSRLDWATILHQRVLPAALALSAAAFLLGFDRKDTPVAKTRVARLICGGIAFLSSISFGFYLFHSLALRSIAPYVTGNGGMREFAVLAAAGALITLPFAYAFTCLFGANAQRKR